MSCYLVQETDGVSRFTLEDGSGFLLLEDCPEPPAGDTLFRGGDRRVHHEVIRRHPPGEDDLDVMIAVMLAER